MLVEPHRNDLHMLWKRVGIAQQSWKQRIQSRLDLAAGMLRTLNPESVVERGYAIVTAGKKIITDASEVAIGDALNLKMSGGTVRTRAFEIDLRENHGKEKTDL